MGDNNNRNNDVELIKEAIGNPDGCEIDYEIEDVKFYTIRPENGQKTLQIKSSIDIIKIKDFNLYFENCVFENKTLFKDVEFQKDIGFQQEILFDNCRFNKSVDFSNVKFKKSIDFTKSIFEKDVYFEGATFDERISFCKSTSNGSVDFSCSAFNDMADFSETTFKQKALFRKSFFNKKAIFNDVEFGGTESARNSHVNFSDATFKNEAVFSGARFQYEADFQASHFEDVLDFDDSVFIDKVDFQSVSFCNRVTFNNTTFQSEAGSQDSSSKTQVLFSNAIFDDNVEFEDVKFLQKVFFEKTQFKKDASFSNSTFNEANFFQSKFYQNAYFYGATFQDFPNFLQTIFNGDVNFTNTELDFGFDGVKNEIKENYNKRKEKTKKHKIANEFRDSFRNIKSLLIEQHNMLDASNYHRIELYCKELELEYRREEKAKNSGIRDIVDRIQLMLYRLTSDHHTNLLLILNNILILIAMFGIANLVLDALKQNGEVFVCIGFIIMSILLMMSRATFATQKDFLRYLIIIKRRKKKIFLLLACLLRCCAVVGAYVMTMYTIFTTPSSVLPILGKLIENKSGEVCLFVVGNVKLLCCGGASYSQTLNLIYMLFLFLLLWSLQKTARKNTIVPN